MYSKRLCKWIRYLGCMETAVSVRRAASLVGIHASTAFYWRHRLLDHALVRDVTRLAGLVELTTFRMAYSEKGSRGETCPWTPRVHVICARDRQGAAFALPEFGDRESNFRAVLHNRLATGATLVTDGRRLSGACIFARRYRIAIARCARFGHLHPGDTAVMHVGNVVAQIARFRIWLRPFRGVATAYLSNYLIWHRRVDGTSEGQAGSRWVRATTYSPTLPANSDAAGEPANQLPPSRRAIHLAQEPDAAGSPTPSRRGAEMEVRRPGPPPSSGCRATRGDDRPRSAAHETSPDTT